MDAEALQSMPSWTFECLFVLLVAAVELESYVINV